MKPPTLAPAYAHMVPILAEVAQSCGYALAVHGSMQRDLDLLACPWTDEAVAVNELVTKLMDACSGYLVEQRENRDPGVKPHGRLAWSIHLHGGAFIDLSVMPRVKKPYSYKDEEYDNSTN